MTKKTCTGCGIEKTIDCFSNSKRGLYARKSKCKECTKSYNKQYHKSRWQGDEGFRLKAIANALKWSAENPEKRAIIAKKRNEKAFNAAPEKMLARALVNQRVRFGRMPRASSLECVECGNVAAHYHHHNGYDFKNRYDVVPVCAQCHKLVEDHCVAS